MPSTGTHRPARSSVRTASTRSVTLAALLLAAASCRDTTAAAPATSLRFASVPGEVAAGAPFTTAVEVIGADGHRSAVTSKRVTLSLGNGAPLSGPTTVLAVSGVATFDGLAITRTGDSVRLIAGAAGSDSSSAVLRVRASAPSGSRSSFFPESALFVAGVPTAGAFTFADAFCNPIANAPVSVSSSLPGSQLSQVQG